MRVEGLVSFSSLVRRPLLGPCFCLGWRSVVKFRTHGRDSREERRGNEETSILRCA